MNVFKDRREAGQFLVKHLKEYKDQPDVVVLTLPRGGVIVGNEIAQALHRPLDLVITRKIGAPGNPELAIGSVGENVEAWNRDMILEYGIPEIYLQTCREKERKEIQRRLCLYRQGKPPLSIKDKKILLVDDGIATGFTMLAAIRSLRNQQPKGIVVVAPVGARPSLVQIAPEVDDIVVPYVQTLLGSISQYYDSFPQISDEEVMACLQECGTSRSHKALRPKTHETKTKVAQ